MHPVRLIFGLIERLLAIPVAALRILMQGVIFNPRIGPLRHVATAAIAYVAFALLLVYVVAPVRGFVGHWSMGEKLRYDAERWLATAIYDAGGSFVGTFDLRADSRGDVNFTDAPIEVGDHVANPDHKSIPVREVPPAYWNCLVFHEDRYLGGLLNPYGIDLVGVLKIPYSTLTRSIATRRPTLGVGGSTLPMQIARVIYKTPPSASEGGLVKLGRKLREWWIAPVIYHELTRGGDDTPLKQWAANHIWLAQRTGGQPLHGVEMTSRVVFGKEAGDLTEAEQFVLASAVNKPIILLSGSDRLNEVRMDRWRYITEVRARLCAERLITDPERQKRALFELVQMASGPPDPRVKARLQEALEKFAPSQARRAQANPMARVNALLPSARFGLVEEMKQAYGRGWREHVRGVTTTIDAAENLAFHERIKAELARLEPKVQARISPPWTLDPRVVQEGAGARRMPFVTVVAADAKGDIVRYYESGESAVYFGSPFARDRDSGRYLETREARHIASTGKVLLAIALANEQRDTTDTTYPDPDGAARTPETCERGGGGGTGERRRRAVVAFACSLNGPLIQRAAALGQERMRRLVTGFGFNLPPPDAAGEGTPPSTAAVLGLLGGSPRRVHHMSAVVLAALLEQNSKPVREPSLVRRFDFTTPQSADASVGVRAPIVPRSLVRADGSAMLRTLLSAPLCHRHGGAAHGTLKSLAHWCAVGRPDLRLHFAKTGTSTTADPDATVDTWTTGGIQFANGAAYSYVVTVGTGSPRDPWATKLHAAQTTVPLVEALLEDLKEHARRHPQPSLVRAVPTAAVAPPAAPRDDWKSSIFRTN
jgi:membrane peptidoglycan carboxypeptidase